MREIKFKGWLAGIGKMTYSHTLDELMNWNTKPEDNETAVWLQYTGLKDKNGKEIYEGDLWIARPQGAPYIIQWYEIGWYLLRAKTKLYENADGLALGEVIGNIYENPELLN